MKTWIVFLFPLAIILNQHADGYTASGNTYQTNGSSSDVQAAINAASKGATIVIPDGSYTWSQPVTSNNFVHIKAQDYGKVTITRAYTGGDLLTLNASTAGNVELAGIVFTSNMDGSSDGYSFTLFVNQLGGLPVLVHDCSFTTGNEYAIQWHGNGGVIWNCSFRTHSDMLGGITFVNTSPDDRYWNQPDSIGASGDPNGGLNTYVEDCSFYDATIAMSNFDDNSRVVWRHNLMSNATLASHGQETSIWGCRHWEIYGNTFVYSTSGTAFGGDPYPLNLFCWFEVRGGTGVVTANAMPLIPFNKSGVQLNVFSINRADSVPCQTAYPAAHQTGQGWSSSSNATFGTPVVPYDGTGAILDPLYVWGNTGTETSDPGYVALNQYSPDDCGHGERIGVFLQQNRDYFVNVAKPNWTPFTYPHPLRTGQASPQPTPTPAPTPTATPTPSPTPAPTATPTQPGSGPGSSPNPSTWNGQLAATLAREGWSQSMIDQLLGFITEDPPWVDSQGDYYVWKGEIDSDMHRANFSAQSVSQFDQFFIANPNPS